MNINHSNHLLLNGLFTFTFRTFDHFATSDLFPTKMLRSKHKLKNSGMKNIYCYENAIAVTGGQLTLHGESKMEDIFSIYSRLRETKFE